MYFKFLTFLFVVLLLTRETPKLRVSGMSARMIRDGVPTHRVAEYVRLERQLFEIEKACIEEGENRVHEALVVSKKIASAIREPREHYSYDMRINIVYGSCYVLYGCFI